MIQAARIALIAYAVLMAAGGVMGAKSGSVVSLIAGGFACMLSIAAFIWSGSDAVSGLSFGLLVGIIVGISGLLRYMKTHSFMPAGLIMTLSVIAVLLISLGLNAARSAR